MLTPNLNHAQSFLTALDEESDKFCFQTFADTDGKKLTRQFHGSLEQHADALADLNQRGAGVFVTVNQTNGKGRKKADITRIRALFVDLDGAPLEPLQNAATAPHITVQSSPGRFHAYWRVSDCDVEQCEPALKQLIAKFNADPACCDRSRVLRLPGFYHRKAEPYLVHMLDSSPGEYAMADFNLPLNPGLNPPKAPSHPTEKDRDDSSHISVLSVLSVGEAINRTLPEADGQRNARLFDFARLIKALLPNATKEELRPIVRQWHESALPFISTKEFTTTWYDFCRGLEKVRYAAGTTLNQIIGDIDMSAEIPDGLARLGYSTRAIRLFWICKRLQEANGSEPFFISSRQAGEQLGIHYTEAAKMLWALKADGVIQEVSKGVGNRASRYRYIWPE